AHHALELLRRVVGEQLEPRRRVLGRARLEEVLERPLERVEPHALGSRLVEHAVLRVDPGRQWVRPQEPRAEAVDRANPGAFGLARVLALAQLEEARANALLELGRRLLGER